MRGFILRILINSAALAVITYGFLPGIRIVGENFWAVLIGVALVYGVVNALVKPLVSLLTCALTLLTFGLFRLIINGAMLLLTAELSRVAERTLGGRLIVDNLLWAIVGALIASVVSIILENMLDVDEKRSRD